ncbi:hypothetical protein V8E54_001078 [Elaphomyces granulatus]
MRFSGGARVNCNPLIYQASRETFLGTAYEGLLIEVENEIAGLEEENQQFGNEDGLEILNVLDELHKFPSERIDLLREAEQRENRIQLEAEQRENRMKQSGMRIESGMKQSGVRTESGLKQSSNGFKFASKKTGYSASTFSSETVEYRNAIAHGGDVALDIDVIAEAQETEHGAAENWTLGLRNRVPSKVLPNAHPPPDNANRT